MDLNIQSKLHAFESGLQWLPTSGQAFRGDILDVHGSPGYDPTIFQMAANFVQVCTSFKHLCRN